LKVPGSEDFSYEKKATEKTVGTKGNSESEEKSSSLEI
jgi:hypothetical protein